MVLLDLRLSSWKRYRDMDIFFNVVNFVRLKKLIFGILFKNCKKYYRVKWVDSWEPEDNLNEACQNLIDEFWSSSVQDETGGEVNRSELKVTKIH